MIMCKICGANFAESDDSVVMCNHHGNGVHMECCSNECSDHGGPCDHSQGIFKKE